MSVEPIQAVLWDEAERALQLLDQRALPAEEHYVLCRSVEEAARAIEDMTVRGAPAIGIAAACPASLP